MEIKVQAFDLVLGQWLNRTVLDVDNGGRVLIHWAGYTRYFDAWLDALEVRKPEGERPLDRQCPVLKSNFPKRQHPKHLQKDDLTSVCVTTTIGLRQKWWKKRFLLIRGETLSFSKSYFLSAG